MKIREAIPPLLILAALFACWEGVVLFYGIPHYILPAPTVIFATIFSSFGLLVSHGLVTLGEIVLGFLLSLVIGFALAATIHFSRTMETALMPLIIASQTVPVFAVAPLLIIWFGYGIGSKVVMTMVIVFFPITINTVKGLRSVDPDILALMKILEANRLQIFFKACVPSALPFIFSGIKIGIAVSVIGAVIGEWVGSTRGLGFLMIHANAQLNVELVFASIFFLSLIGVILYALAGLAERIFTPGPPGSLLE